MLFTTHTPKIKSISHRILGYSPFTVEFICYLTGKRAIERYAVVLTQRELEEEYPYITFI